MNRLIYCLFFCITFSCTNTIVKEPVTNDCETQPPPAIVAADSNKLRTGFYFLSSPGNGIEMTEEATGKKHFLQKVPFASVDNVCTTRLVTTETPNGPYIELCLTFNKIGAGQMERGTASPRPKPIAAVIAGRLLLVAKNPPTITTGVMCVGLSGYSLHEMNAMKAAVDRKM